VLSRRQKVSRAGELKAILKEKQQLFVNNLAEKMLIYALGARAGILRQTAHRQKSRRRR